MWQCLFPLLGECTFLLRGCISSSAPRQSYNPHLSSASPPHLVFEGPPHVCCFRLSSFSGINKSTGPHVGQETVLSYRSLSHVSPKMGIIRSGHGYFRISHVVLYLEESDSSSPVVCFGFPLAWVRGPWEPWKRGQVGQTQSTELVRRFLYLEAEFILPSRALCSYPHTLVSPVPKLWRRRSHPGNQKPAALRIFLPQVGRSSRGKVGHGSRARSRHATLICSFFIVKKLLTCGETFIMCAWRLSSNPLFRTRFNIFGCTFCHLSPSIYACWGNHTWLFGDLPFFLTFYLCFPRRTLLVLYAVPSPMPLG